MDLSRPLRVIAPTVDADVLAALASVDGEFTGRELHRIIGRHSQTGVNRVLNRLVQEGIVARTRAGSARRYRLNREHLQADPIIALAGARGRLIERLEGRVSEWTTPAHFAAMFGSSAGGEPTDGSDVDLLVVRSEGIDDGDEGWAVQLVELRRDVGRWTGNDCDLLEYSMEEIEDAFDAHDPFIIGLARTMVLLSGSRSYLHRPRRARARSTT